MTKWIAGSAVLLGFVVVGGIIVAVLPPRRPTP